MPLYEKLVGAAAEETSGIGQREIAVVEHITDALVSQSSDKTTALREEQSARQNPFRFVMSGHVTN